MRWLQFRLEIISLVVLLVVGCLAVSSRDSSLIKLTVNEAGLLLTYTLSVSELAHKPVPSKVFGKYN